MKFIFSTIFLFAISLNTWSQDAAPRKEKREKEDQLIIDLTYEALVNKPGDLNFKWYNNGFNIQFLYDFPLGYSPFSVAIGLGLSTQSYYSGHQVRTQFDSTLNREIAEWQRVDTSYRNNKIATTLVEVPLEIRWRSKESPSGYRWKIAAGVKAGYNFDTHDKLVMKNRDKYKTYIFPYMNPYRVGSHIRFGYGKVNLTAFYSFTPFFEEGRGREMNQLSIGVSILPF